VSSPATPLSRPTAPWSTFVAEAPTLAAAVRARFEANLHHVLGTIRPDGAPRLSGTELRFEDEQVTLGMMPGSRKLSDVRADPRVELHSAPLEEDLARGDAKLCGHLVEIVRNEPGHEGAGFFRLELALVSLVRVAADELVLQTWRPGRGTGETRRR
jgi:hypothetical protein